MKIINASPAPVYWRVFAAWDESCTIGLKDGIIGSGQVAFFDVPDHTLLKLELRKSGLTGEQLLDPVDVLDVQAEVAVNATGEVRHVPSLPIEQAIASDESAAQRGLYDNSKLDVAEPAPAKPIFFESQWTGGPVFWRCFAPHDVTYAFGLAQGVVTRQQSTEIGLHGFSTIQIEFRRGALTGGIIVNAGMQWSSSAKLFMQDDGLYAAGVLVTPLPGAGAKNTS